MIFIVLYIYILFYILSLLKIINIDFIEKTTSYVSINFLIESIVLRKISFQDTFYIFFEQNVKL